MFSLEAVITAGMVAERVMDVSERSDIIIEIFAAIVLLAVISRYSYIEGVVASIIAGHGPFSGISSLTVNVSRAGEGSARVSYNQSALEGYALRLINKDREEYGLLPVSLSNTTSGQQHAESMLSHSYFSHWDLHGMKPYMRYTLLGGNGSVSENIAYETAMRCLADVCTGALNPNQSLQEMEYSMMYNDTLCCNNGHRKNILDPNHNRVSIGIAYNGSTMYFVEDFIDSYIIWSNGTPAYSNTGEVYLSGIFPRTYSLSQVYVSYDPPLQNYTKANVPGGPYGYGAEIAGVASSSSYYFQGIHTIVADRYSYSGNSFDVRFSIENLVGQYGAGEYTIVTLLNNTGLEGANRTFVGATYTLFLNSSGAVVIPEHA